MSIRLFSCEFCGWNNHLTEPDSVHVEANRTVDNAREHIPASFECTKCKKINTLNWHKPNYKTT